jgi:hypothetical protein
MMLFLLLDIFINAINLRGATQPNHAVRCRTSDATFCRGRCKYGDA